MRDFEYGLLVALLLCAGCDQVFGLDRGDAGPDDGPPGAADALPPAHPCLGRAAPPTFCYDFDEDALVGYEGETELPISPLTVRVNVDKRGPSTTGPNGLWFTALGTGVGTVMTSDNAVQGQRIDETLSIRLGEIGTNAGASKLSTLVLAPSGTSCQMDLWLRKDDQHLEFIVSCPDPSSAVDLGEIGSTWLELGLRFDVAAGEASVRVGPLPPVTIGFTSFGTATGQPSIQFGIDPSTTGLSVGFDDIAIAVQ